MDTWSHLVPGTGHGSWEEGCGRARVLWLSHIEKGLYCLGLGHPADSPVSPLEPVTSLLLSSSACLLFLL